MIQNEKIIIVRGNFSEGNYGDDALLLAVQDLLGTYFSGDQIRFQCPAVASSRAVSRGVRLASMEDVARASLIVYGGGTQFFSFPGRVEPKQSLPRRLLRVAWNPSRLLLRYRAKHRSRLESRIPMIGVGLGFGPFVSGSAEERETRQLASQMRFLWVRDPASEKFCFDCGIQSSIRGADMCFLPSFQRKHITCRELPKTPAQRQVGIVLRDWKHGEEQSQGIGAYLEFAAICRQNGLSAKFFVFCPGQDQSIVRQLSEANENAVSWDAETMGLSEYAAQLGSCDVTVTSRFHAAVFALLFGKPFIAIRIEPKLKMISELMGAEDVCVEREVIPRSLFVKVENILDHSSEYGERACRVREEQTVLASHGKAQFDKAIKSLL